MPILSIIVPVYKVESYLERCIESILAQSFKDFECILINDGSPDNCGEIIERYAANDSRIIPIHQENQGECGARNAGLSVMDDGPGYVGFVDSDDYIAPDMFEKLIENMENQKTDISCCRWFDVLGEEDGGESVREVVFNMVPYMNRDTFFQHILDTPFTILGTVWNKLFRRELVNSTFPVGIEVGEDTVFLVEYCKNISSASFINEALYYYQIRGDSLTHSIDGKMVEGLEAWKSVLDVSMVFGGKSYKLAEKKYVDTCMLRLQELKSDPENNYYQIARKHYLEYIRNNWYRILNNMTIPWKTRLFYLSYFLKTWLCKKNRTIRNMVGRFWTDCKEFSVDIAFRRIIRDLPYLAWDRRYNYYMRGVQKYIHDKYYFYYKELKKEYDPLVQKKGSNIIWVMWWQGELDMPEVVRMCYEQLLRICNPYEIVLITQDNWKEYLSLPVNIINKNERGMFSITHLSDIIRWGLLTQYGGFWLDIKIYASQIPEEAFSKRFYSLRAPGIWANSIFPGDWFCACLAFNHSYEKLAWCMYKLFLRYWSEHNILVDYFLTDFFTQMIAFDDDEIRQYIEAVPENWEFQQLRSHMNDPYDDKKISEMFDGSDLHALSYKEKYKMKTDDGQKTIYQHLLVNGEKQ